MTQTISLEDAAKIIGVSIRQVTLWANRQEDPLPTVVVGAKGGTRRVVASEINAFLVAEAARSKADTRRGQE